MCFARSSLFSFSSVFHKFCCLILALPSHRLSNGLWNVVLNCWLPVKYLSSEILDNVRVVVVQEVCSVECHFSTAESLTPGKSLKLKSEIGKLAQWLKAVYFSTRILFCVH
jgi:hypothetical protein